MSSPLQRYVLETARNVQLAKRLLRRANPQVRAARRHRAAFYDRVWAAAAQTVGAELRALDASLWEMRRGPRRTFVYQNYTDLDAPVTLRVAGNKAIVHELLRDAGVPVPPHRRFDVGTMADAVRFLAEMAAPCVVKPLAGTGAGQGVTTGIRDKRQLRGATAIAASFSKELLIERELVGANYRLLYLDGELLDVVRRDPPRLTGDARSTVRELVQRMNRQRLDQGFAAAQTVLLCDRDMQHTLARQGLTLRSVPDMGREVLLKTVVNDNQASDNVEARAELCDGIVEAGARAARAVNVRLAGVDVITTDGRVPLEASGGVVLEVNTAPGYYMHYYRRGEPCPVAERVLARLLDEARPVRTGGERSALEATRG